MSTMGGVRAVVTHKGGGVGSAGVHLGAWLLLAAAFGAPAWGDPPAPGSAAAPAPGQVEGVPVARLPPFPHPVITEVLYAVPTGPDGDASGDGERQVAGDEFVEIVNPHDRPIELLGYRVTDGARPGRSQFSFVFPAVTIGPGEVAVVFNGNQSRWSGPVGTSTGAAPPSKAFAGARVFTANMASERASFGNSQDCVVLWDRDARPIQCVRWGRQPPKPPPGVLVLDDAPGAQGVSIQRAGIEGVFRSHDELAAAPADAPDPGAPVLWSPGVFGARRVDAPPGGRDPGGRRPDASTSTPGRPAGAKE